MRTTRLHLEQLYYKLADVRDILDILNDTFPGATANTVIRMGGGFHRHGGLDDWFADLEFTKNITEHQLDTVIADLPFSHGITYTTV